MPEPRWRIAASPTRSQDTWSRAGATTDVRVTLSTPCAAPDGPLTCREARRPARCRDRKSTRLNSSHGYISYAVFCLKKKKLTEIVTSPMPPASAEPLRLEASVWLVCFAYGRPLAV